MGDPYEPTTDPQVPEDPGTGGEATFGGGYSETPQQDGTILRCEIWNLPGGGTERRNCVTVGSPQPPSEHPTPPPGNPPPSNPPPSNPPPSNPPPATPEPDHNIEYKPKYDARGRIVAYEMWVDGVLQQTFDYTHLYEDLDSIEKPGTFQEFMQGAGYNYRPVEGTAEYGALSDLIATLQDPNTTAQDKAMAEEQTARGLGYGSVQEMLDDIENRRQMTAGGSNAMEGLSEAERAAYERSMANTRKKSEDVMRRTLDQVLSGATGNSTRNALIRANEFIGQIQDVEIQGNVQLAMMEAERRKEQFDQQFAMYQDLLDRGQATTDQVYQALYNNRMAALDGYAKQVSTIVTQNEQYLQMYQQDLQRIQLVSDQVYKSIEAELNINEDMREAMSEAFNMYWAEVMTPYNLDLLKQQIQAGKTEAAMAVFSGILKGLGLIVGLVL